MDRAEVVWQFRRAGGGTVWVHRPRGSWRAIRFQSGPLQLAKLLGLAAVLDRLGAATTQATGRLVAQLTGALDVPSPRSSRDGPAALPATPNAP